MKKSILFFLIAFSLASCTQAVFTEQQPKGEKTLSSFPNDVQGVYTSGNNDSLIVKEKSFSYKISITNKQNSLFGNNNANSESKLSDDVQLRKMENYYIINQKKEKKEWSLLIGERRKDSLFVSWVNLDNDTILTKMKAITKVKEVIEDGKVEKYVLSPSAKEFSEILKSGALIPIASFKKVK